MHLCFSCISYLPFGTEIAGGTKTQPCWILTNNNVLERVRGRSLFIAWGVGGGMGRRILGGSLDF